MVKVIFVKSEENDADIWTKNVNRNTFKRHTEKFMTSMPEEK